MPHTVLERRAPKMVDSDTRPRQVAARTKRRERETAAVALRGLQRGWHGAREAALPLCTPYSSTAYRIRQQIRWLCF
jgi:hypothetical protein